MAKESKVARENPINIRNQAKELIRTAIPIMGVLAKGHKPLQENGDPKTRPLCYTRKTSNWEMSEFTSSTLDPAAQTLPSVEVISTEETANKIDNSNMDLKNGTVKPYRGLVVGSLDASALYPSLLIKKCTKVAAQRVAKSGIRFEGFNLEWACIYVAL